MKFRVLFERTSLSKKTQDINSCRKVCLSRFFSVSIDWDMYEFTQRNYFNSILMVILANLPAAD